MRKPQLWGFHHLSKLTPNNGSSDSSPQLHNCSHCAHAALKLRDLLREHVRLGGGVWAFAGGHISLLQWTCNLESCFLWSQRLPFCLLSWTAMYKHDQIHSPYPLQIPSVIPHHISVQVSCLLTFLITLSDYCCTCVQGCGIIHWGLGKPISGHSPKEKWPPLRWTL